MTNAACECRCLRKKKYSDGEGMYTFNAYVCGNCSAIFEVSEHVSPAPEPKQRMSGKNPIPWGMRERQA